MKTPAYCCSLPQLLWLCDSSAVTGHVSLTVVIKVNQPSGSLLCLEISPLGIFWSSVDFFVGKVPTEVFQQVAKVWLADRCLSREF